MGRKLELLRRFKPLLIIPPLALGALALWWFTNSRPEPARREAKERVAPVRAIVVVRRDVVPRVLGYGTAEPARTWQAVAQVPGRIVELHERLVEGGLVEAGAVLARIDPAEYELAIAELQATIASIGARLAELDASEANTKAVITLEERALELRKDEVARKRELLEGASGSQAALDEAERNYLAQQAKVQGLENALRLSPAQRASLEADRKASAAKLATARLNLEYTTIAAPFRAIVADEDVEQSQFVSAGQQLAELHDVSIAEVTARLPMSKFRHIIDTTRTQIDLADLVSGEMVRGLNIKAVVRLRLGDIAPEWQARVDRLASALDPQTRSIGAVVAVEDHYGQAIPGRRPPIVKGMYLEVELSGPPKSARVLVPRAALHGDLIYVVDADGRLARRAAAVEFTMQDFAVIGRGLADGEVVVVSDPIPAIDGMLLAVTRDEQLEQRLAAVARGEASLR